MPLLAGKGCWSPLELLSDSLQALITRLPLSAMKPHTVRDLLKVFALIQSVHPQVTRMPLSAMKPQSFRDLYKRYSICLYPNMQPLNIMSPEESYIVRELLMLATSKYAVMHYLHSAYKLHNKNDSLSCTYNLCDRAQCTDVA